MWVVLVCDDESPCPSRDGDDFDLQFFGGCKLEKLGWPTM